MPVACEFDDGAGAAARLGLIVLSADETLEHEARTTLRDPEINLFHARIPSHPEVTPETLRLMEAALPDTAALLPAGLDVIGYACTSGATVIGPEMVAALIGRHHPRAAVTDPLSAVLSALDFLGARRIAMVTPYVPEVTAPIRAALARSGIDVLADVSFACKEERTVARITEASTLAAIAEAGGAGGPDAVFVSCTNLRSFGILDRAEAMLDIPVISSNQAMIWHMLRLAGVDPAGRGPGRLFRVSGPVQNHLAAGP